MNVHGMARVGVLAVGLGIGAAWAHTPVASADTSNDWLSAVDSFLSGASPAASPADVQISFNGTDLFSTVGNEASAYTVAGQYGLAIAYGDNATAYAEGGTGDYALASGTGADAYAQGGTGVYALASGTNANAEAGSLATGATGNNYDTAVDIGNNGPDDLLDNTGAYAGNGSLQDLGTDVGTDSNDSAYDIGNNSAGVGNSGAFAGYLSGISGNGDTAYDAGNNSASSDGAFAVDGNNNYANDSGNNTAIGGYAIAADGNSNTAIADTSYSISGQDVSAGDGNGNYAYVYGPDNSTATAYDGDSNVAYVSDPFGAAGSPDSAVAGGGFSNDLAEVLLAHGNATADTANLLYDIVSLFGPSSGIF